MNNDLRQLVEKRLESEGLLQKNWSSLVLAACSGGDALQRLLVQNAKTEPEHAYTPGHQRIATITLSVARVLL